MRVPKNDLFINRTLFNNDPTRPFISKDQTDLNQKEQLETEKKGDNKQFVNPKSREDLVRLKETGFVKTNSLRMFFYLKEFFAGWLTEFSIRPTQLNIILSATLYLVALSSTIQKRDGDRWLKSLLDAKLPGYSTLYQESSWETFRNYTCKRLLASQAHKCHDSRYPLGNQNPYIVSSFDQNKTQDVNNYRTNRVKSFNALVEKKFENLRGQATPLKKIEKKHFQFLSSPLGRGNAIGFEKRQFVDLYKDKALIYLRSPWEKGIRKDFVGFFAKRQLKAATHVDNHKNQSHITQDGTANQEEALDTNHIVLPWYRIDAYNRPNRIVFAAPQPEKSKATALSTPSVETPGAIKGESMPSMETEMSQGELKESDVHCNKQNRDTFDSSKRQKLRDRRERSLLGLQEKQKRLKLGGTDLYSTPSQVSSHLIRDKILGLEYLFPFQTSKARVYVQNDSIPLKLESAYSLRHLFAPSSRAPSTEKTSKTSSILEAALLNSARNQLKEQKNQLFVKNQQLFFGKNFYLFEKRLRELFYWYGLLPPSNFMGLIDKKTSQSQVDKQISQDDLGSKVEASGVEAYGVRPKVAEPDRNPDYTLEESIQAYRPDSLQGGIQSTSQDEEVLTDIATVDLLKKDKGEDELSYDKLTTLVCKELAQLASNNKILNSNFKTQASQEMLDLFASTPEWKRLENKKACSDSAESPTEIAEKPKVSSANSTSLTRSGDRFNLGVKQQIEKLIDESADQSSPLTDLTESTSSGGATWKRLGLEAEELQETVARFPFKNWPLQANINSFAQQDGTVSNRFEKNNVLFTRLMSGYKFPDCTKQKTNRLFKEFVLPHLFFSGSVGFSHSYLINQTLLRPLYIKLPPALPFSFYEKLAFSLCEDSSSLAKFAGANKVVQRGGVSRGVEDNVELEMYYPDKQVVASSDVDTLNRIPPNSDVKIEYKRISLQELKLVKEAFTKLGRDYQDYLDMPKDSPPAIRISPSLEDDNVIKLEAEQRKKGDEERVTTFERLQQLRQRGERFELGKGLRPFAYKNQFACQPDASTLDASTLDKQPVLRPSIATPTDQVSSFNNNILGKSVLDSDSSHLVSQGVQAPAFTEAENSWIRFRFGPQNLLSDRKYSFFGRKHMLTKRLVAQEQKEIAEQITKNSYRAPGTKLFDEKGHKTSIAFEKASASPGKDSPTEQKKKAAIFNSLSGTGKGDLHKSTYTDTNRLLSNRKLQRRARKGLIKLLGLPDLSAHNIQGSLNRTRKPNRALRGKVLKSSYSHLRWQKKRFASRMLGTPCNRHLIMPEITSNDWKKMLEWQLKNYFFLEEKRLEPLVKENPEKSFKVRQLHIYLPWVTVRTPSNKPFQWPYTRLDCANVVTKGDIADKSGLPKTVMPKDTTQKTEALYRLPEYKPVYYWDSGRSVSLSVPASKIKQNKKSAFSNKTLSGNYKRANGSTARSKTSMPDGVRRRTREESYLYEPLTNQSWLLIYRLFLAFAVQNLVKYVYRVSLKGFMIEIANSDVGLTVTSPQFREWLQGTQPKSFYTPKKRLRDIAAIEESIPVISEIVWYLRNSGRGKKASHGFLLVGPAGSEKSAVVQAIAGECRVPVVVQPMNALTVTDLDPYEQLQDAFKLARQKAPCVLFLDDLDIVGQSRTGVVKNDVGAPDSLFALDTCTAEGKLRFANLSNLLHTELLPTAGNRNTHSSWQLNPLVSNPAYQPDMESAVEQETSAKNKAGRAFGGMQLGYDPATRKLNLLLCLLTEMDGIDPLHGVIILATSEQPALLDPALLRAGRFERKIHVSLPSKERRIQLFKAGTKKIGCMQSIPWDYLGMRTKDMSAANIASAINHSAIKAILDNTVHTVESLEHGLNCVSGLPNRKSSMPVFQGNDPFHYSRLAFYQAGKAVVHNLLLDHPQLGFCTLDDAIINQGGTGSITRESTQVLQSDQAPFTTVSPLSRPEFKYVAQPLVAPSGTHRTEEVVPEEVALEEGVPAVDESVSDTQKGSTKKPELFNSALFGEMKKRERFLRSQFRSSAAYPSYLESKTDKTGKKPFWEVETHKKGTPVSARTRIQFETRLVGLYAGKAAELLHLSCTVVEKRMDQVAARYSLEESVKRFVDARSAVKVKPDLVSGCLKSSKTPGWLWQSDLGSSDLLTASSLIHLMVDRWYLYSQKIFTYKINRLMPSLNHEQMTNRNETLLPRARKLSKQFASHYIKPNFWDITSYTNQAAIYRRGADSANEFSFNKQIYQEGGQINWWQAKVCQALEMRKRSYGRWYRIYLPNLEERETNKEWIPPDTVFHQSLTLSNLAKNRSKESINSVSSSRQSELERYPLPLRESNQLKDEKLTPRFSDDHNRTRETRFTSTDSTLHPSNTSPSVQRLSKATTSGRVTNGGTWKTSLTKVSSSNSVRPLRLVRLHLNKNKQSSPVQSEPSLKTLNDLYLFERDDARQKAVMSCFYTAFNLLNENRELLDYFADHLIRFKILRSHEISKICSLFYPPYE